MVRRQNRDARVPWNPRREPARHALRHARQFRKGDALHRLLPLNLKGNVVGELPGRFLKPLVEGGHVRGEYTKDSSRKLGTASILGWGKHDGDEKITFNEDAELLDWAEQIARAKGTTLEEEVWQWRERRACRRLH